MNKNYKKIITVLSLSLLLTACGGTPSESISTESSSSEPVSTSTDPSSEESTLVSSTEESTVTSEDSSESSTEVYSSTEESTSEYTTSSEVVEDYYGSISDDLEGTDLLNALHALNVKKRTTTVGYSSMGTSGTGYFKYTDYDPDSVQYDAKGQPYGTVIISFYSGNKTNSFNREHVWPKSHGGNLVENDIHMPRPTIATENGSRGNSFYVEGMKDQKYGWDPAMESFGKEDYRGDSARIIFYCCIAETKLNLSELTYHDTTNNNRDNLMGKLTDMLRWNETYEVKDREQRRNSGAEYLQGNRNPFIDHPEYACRIWGKTNSDTKRVCGLA